MVGQRVCKTCKKSKPLIEFPIGKRYTDGYRPVCKICHNHNNSKWRKKNSSYFKDRYQDMADIYHEKQAIWRKANPDYPMTYYYNNKNLVLSLHHKYRARKHKAFMEHIDREEVLYRDLGVCHICKRVVNINDWHLDHIVPLIRGGEHSYKNVAVSHPHCNTVKRDRTLEELWLKSKITS